MNSQKIRIRLKAYDHTALDQSAARIVEAAKKIDMSNAGPYDQGCNEKIQTAFKDYFDGNVDMDGAKANFEKTIKEKFPEIESVNWPE